jgi:hypothetical protein
VLQRIIGGTPGSLINSPLPQNLFAGFNPTLDDAGHEKQEERIFEEFRAALWKVPAAAREARAKALEHYNESAAAARVRLDTRPFVLVLDQIVGPSDPSKSKEKREGGVIPAMVKKSLIPGLIQHIHARSERDLQLVLAVRERGRLDEADESEELGLDALDPSPPSVTLKEIEGDFARFAEEYFLRKDIDAVFRSHNLTTEDWKDQIQSRAKLYKGPKPWSPCALVRFYNEIISAIG